MKPSISKESLVYHDSCEELPNTDGNHVSYGSIDDPFVIRQAVTYPPRGTPPGILSPCVGPSAKAPIRKLVKKVRIDSARNVTLTPGGEKHEPFGKVLQQLIFGSFINVLLLALPFAVASHYLQWSSMNIFVLNFLAMVPLASILGTLTEEVAAHTNQTIGGLINATFGNAVEIVVAIQALLAGEIRVVQASMIGSIFSNLLLVLGCCFFFGGLVYKEQTFSSMVASANMGLLGLSSIAFVLPTPFAEYNDVNDEDALGISRITAVFLIFMYIQMLVFQLKTHADLFTDEEEEETEMSFTAAICGLCGVTAIITQLSDYLVGSIDGFCDESGISRTFVGLIILPIVGNAVEHATAVSVAMKGKMDLAMGVAVGSCVQISLFAAPLTVLVGWMTDKPMSLNFPHFEIILYILSILVVSSCLTNSKTNWLEGSMLITTYILIAVGFWFEKVVDY